MKTKYSYIAVQIEENGKWYAYAEKVSEYDNLYTRLERIRNIQTANVCPTKKAAVELVKFWNDSFRQNGCYMFDDPSF